ncbi:MAG: hypothetical protein IJW54_02515 [Clostridia bacterium]|nr:hypothetical protein [Clostridia bacterium]
MKKMSLLVVALSLILCLVIPFASCGNKETVEGYSYVTIDVNPSVELVVDGETVVSVNAGNDDALVLLAGETIEGMKVEEATEKIVSLCEELGYLTDENNNVKLTVTADNNEIIEKIEEFAEKGAKKGSLKAVINKIPRNADQRKVNELKEENAEIYKKLTAEKLRLIESIMKLSEEMTYEKGAEMNVSELLDMLKELTIDKKHAISDEVREQMETRLNELKQEAKKRVAEIYGDEYLEKWNVQTEIESYYKEIEKKIENIELSEEDIDTILNILKLESVDDLLDNGEVTVESVERYIDKHLIEDEYKTIVEEINLILEKYDQDEYILSEEEINKIKEIMGDVKLEKFEDLEILIKDHEKEVDSIKNQIQISELEKGIIDVIESGYKDMKEQVQDEFEKIIEEANEEFDRIKENRKGRK